MPLWLALLSRRSVTDADVEAALDAAEQWPGTPAARHLIEGTMAMIAALPPSGGQVRLAVGISASNLARLAATLRQPAGVNCRGSSTFVGTLNYIALPGS